MRIYADTSFLISLYSRDVNFAPAARIMRTSEGERLVTTFGELEVVNALQLRVLRKEVSIAQAQAALKDFEGDLRDGMFQLCAL